jgi:hypothetical protein
MWVRAARIVSPSHGMFSSILEGGQPKSNSSCSASSLSETVDVDTLLGMPACWITKMVRVASQSFVQLRLDRLDTQHVMTTQPPADIPLQAAPGNTPGNSSNRDKSVYPNLSQPGSAAAWPPIAPVASGRQWDGL